MSGWLTRRAVSRATALARGRDHQRRMAAHRLELQERVLRACLDIYCLLGFEPGRAEVARVRRACEVAASASATSVGVLFAEALEAKRDEVHGRAVLRSRA